MSILVDLKNNIKYAFLGGDGEAEHDPGGRGVAAVAKHAHGGPYAGGRALKQQLKCLYQILLKWFKILFDSI